MGHIKSWLKFVKHMELEERFKRNNTAKIKYFFLNFMYEGNIASVKEKNKEMIMNELPFLHITEKWLTHNSTEFIRSFYDG